jgi:hypothetical protein
VANPLYVLKCRHYPLRQNFDLSADGSVIHATLLNRALNVRRLLTELLGASKVNDIFPVQVFSLENLVALLKMETENLCAVYSLVPFIA